MKKFILFILIVSALFILGCKTEVDNNVTSKLIDEEILVDEVNLTVGSVNEKGIFNKLLSFIDFGSNTLVSSYSTDKFKYAFQKIIVDSTAYYLVQGDILYTAKELNDYIKAVKDREMQVLKKYPSGIYEPFGVIMIDSQTKSYVRWEKDKDTLRFCYNKKSLGSEYQSVKYALEEAINDWKPFSPIKFSHVQELDALDLKTTTERVDFIVIKSHNGEFDAAAFRPNAKSADRLLRIGKDFLNSKKGYDPVGLMRHELGHIMGLMHEHIRNDAPAECRNEPLDNAVPIGKYDPRSCMHYLCGGKGLSSLIISELDKKTVLKLYNE